MSKSQFKSRIPAIAFLLLGLLTLINAVSTDEFEFIDFVSVLTSVVLLVSSIAILRKSMKQDSKASMTKNSLAWLAILLSLICTAIAFYTGWDMAKEYTTADGKTQALYGITHLYRFSYSTIGFAALFAALLSFKQKESRALSIVALILALLSLIATFGDLWKLWV